MTTKSTTPTPMPVDAAALSALVSGNHAIRMRSSGRTRTRSS